MIALTEAHCPWGARRARAVGSAGAGPTHRLTEGFCQLSHHDGQSGDENSSGLGYAAAIISSR